MTTINNLIQSNKTQINFKRETTSHKLFNKTKENSTLIIYLPKINLIIHLSNINNLKKTNLKSTNNKVPEKTQFRSLKLQKDNQLIWIKYVKPISIKSNQIIIKIKKINQQLSLKNQLVLPHYHIQHKSKTLKKKKFLFNSNLNNNKNPLLKSLKSLILIIQSKNYKHKFISKIT